MRGAALHLACKMAATLEAKINAELTCAICFEFFLKPKALPCQHTFCLKCLEAYCARHLSSNVIDDGRRVECPTCRRPFKLPREGAGALDAAFHINNLMEIRDMVERGREPSQAKAQKQSPLCAVCVNHAPAVCFCEECMFLCAECRSLHGRSPKYLRHLISSLDDGPSTSGPAGEAPAQPHCPAHPALQLDLYCEECRMEVCVECRSSELHRGHPCKRTMEAVHESKDQVLSSLAPLRQLQGNLEVAVRRVGSRSSRVPQQALEVREEVGVAFRRLERDLLRRRDQLLCEVGEMEKGKQAALEGQRKLLEQYHFQLSSYLDMVYGSLDKDGGRMALKLREMVSKHSQQLEREYRSLSMEPSQEANISFMCSEPAFSELGHVFVTSVSLQHSYAEGAGLESAQVHSSAFFEVRLMDKEGKPCSEQLPVVSAQLTAPTGASEPATVLEEEERGCVRMRYTPEVSGHHQLSVKLLGCDVRGSPFKVEVTHVLTFKGNYIRTLRPVTGPWGVAFTDDGMTLVVENKGWKCLSIFDSHGKKQKAIIDSMTSLNVFGTEGLCCRPRGVAVDLSGNILIADSDCNRIQRFTKEGVCIGVVGSKGSGPRQFLSPVGLRVSPSGEVYVCDRFNHRIQVLSCELSFLREFGSHGSGSGQLQNPWDLALDSHGNVYVADVGNYRIQVFTPKGKWLRFFGSEGSKEGYFAHISGVCIDRNDYVYVSDRNNNRVSIFSSEGKYCTAFGSYGYKDRQFVQPVAISIDDQGQVYVSDYDDRVQVFQ